MKKSKKDNDKSTSDPTLFEGPLVTRQFLKDHPDQCIAGFLVGFTVSILFMDEIRS